MRFILPTLITVFVLSGCVSSGSQSVSDLDVIGLGDNFEQRVEINSFGFDTTNVNPLRGDPDVDKAHPFFRVYIDKSTKQIGPPHLYVMVRVREDTRWNRLTYLSRAGEPIVLNGQYANADPQCSQWGCSWLREVVFALDMDTMQDWANRADDMQMRLSATTANQRFDFKISPKEAEAMLVKIEEVLAQM